MTNDISPANENETKAPVKTLSPAATRALKEAQERRQAQADHDPAGQQPAKEYGGRGGQDPSRFGDWEIDGRAIDF